MRYAKSKQTRCKKKPESQKLGFFDGNLVLGVIIVSNEYDQGQGSQEALWR
jgi:hypothetical protein